MSEGKWLMNNEAFCAAIKGIAENVGQRVEHVKRVPLLFLNNNSFSATGIRVQFAHWISHWHYNAHWRSLTLYSVTPEDRRRASRIGADPRALGVRREFGDSARRFGADASSLSEPYVTRGLSVSHSYCVLCQGYKLNFRTSTSISTHFTRSYWPFPLYVLE